MAWVGRSNEVRIRHRLLQIVEVRKWSFKGMTLNRRGPGGRSGASSVWGELLDGHDDVDGGDLSIRGDGDGDGMQLPGGDEVLRFHEMQWLG